MLPSSTPSSVTVSKTNQLLDKKAVTSVSGETEAFSTRRGETGGRTSTTSRVQEANKSRHKANSIFFIAIRIYMYKKRKGRKETTRSAPTRPPALFPFDNK
ncbi:hypothetical protein NXW71_09640 [Parabacteroides merdae]|nr:hypothetical protein [Parabacteroides merdae]